MTSDVDAPLNPNQKKKKMSYKTVRRARDTKPARLPAHAKYIFKDTTNYLSNMCSRYKNRVSDNR